MRTTVIIEIDPCLSDLQKSSQAVIGTTISHSQLEEADESLGVAIVRGRASSAHREHKAFLQEQMTGLLGSILFPLVAMPDTARNLKGHGLDRVRDQICSHMIVKSHPQNSSGPLV